jgi:hypothetical protein
VGDLRPSLDVLAAILATATTVTLASGAQITTDVIRLAPEASAPNLDVEGIVAATRPRFAFRKALVPGLAPGDRFAIPAGPDAGDYTVDFLENADLDPDVVEVVATRR